MGDNWYYAENQQQKGPITARQLVNLAAAGTVRPDTLVWCEGMADWVTANHVDALFPGATAQEPAVSDPDISAAVAQRPEMMDLAPDPAPTAPRPQTARPVVDPMVGGGAPMPQHQPMPLSYHVPRPMGAPPPNYLVQSILVTLCCCIPFGIVSIVYAAQVNGKYQRGDYVGAAESSQNAKKWAWVAFWCGLVIGFIQIIFKVGAANRGRGF